MQRESEGIDRARFLIVGQPENGAGRLMRHQIECLVPREAVLLHCILNAVDPDDVTIGPADDREQDRRMAGPPARIGIGHQFAALRIAQMGELGAERVDRRREAGRRDFDQVRHSTFPFASSSVFTDRPWLRQ